MMKKLITMILTFVLLFSFACADSVSAFVDRWNNTAPEYGVPTIEEKDAVIDHEECYTFKGDGWKFRICFWKGTLYAVEAYAEQPELFLGICVTMGASAVIEKTADEMITYQCNILRGFLRANTEGYSLTSPFGIFSVYIEKDGSGYELVMEEK